MGCWCPITGYYSKVIGPSGKRGITFQRSAAHTGVPIRLPCGRCTGCRLETSRQWAIRILHEKKLHDASCFGTLTYDNENLPEGGTLVKRDFQLFMKRLRKGMGDGIRFFACGEYGDLNKRPHYHFLLLNRDFGDKRQVGANRRGDKYYDSVELRSYWPIGHVLLGDVTFDSAAYVARYCMKKINGDGADAHYTVVDANGVVTRRAAEFTVMSRRPGIGTGWYERYGNETYAHDNCIINNRPVRPPRFYDGKRNLLDPDGFAKLKEERRRKALANFKENLVDRRRVKERLLSKHQGKLHREI
uniref:Replication protein VP4 n=1 Tax=Gokushovirinae environmental samples TaxID=1478972 RepID=A0A2R3UAJ7_9VIRU|nr:replication protein VP4 [Gokushovirinae environmental samples]